MHRKEPEASIIQEALEGYASGRFDSQAEVRRFLEPQPIMPTRNGKGEIHAWRITQMLTNPICAGYIEVKKWNVSLREGKHEGLIYFTTFEKIQERIKGNAKAPARKDLNADFPLRGFITCECCGNGLTGAWSKGKRKHYAYYSCHTRHCEAFQKSIPRAKLEGEFETVLRGLSPTRTLFQMARMMFVDGWNQRHRQTIALAKSLKAQAAKIEKQIAQVLDRILDAESGEVASIYEKRMAKLEREKIVLMERAKESTRTKATFDEMFEHAMSSLANPWKLWDGEILPCAVAYCGSLLRIKLPTHESKGFEHRKSPCLSRH